MRLKSQQHIALVDADYILCVYDAEGRSEPGDNPRALVLFTPEYAVKTWGSFTCEPGFVFGAKVSPFWQKKTSFITINQSSRNGGQLYFEKYLIASDQIVKLGEGYDLGKIPDAR